MNKILYQVYLQMHCATYLDEYMSWFFKEHDYKVGSIEQLIILRLGGLVRYELAIKNPPAPVSTFSSKFKDIIADVNTLFEGE